jgi:hypothetical protein
MILTDLHEENDSINNNSDFVPVKQNSSQYQKDLYLEDSSELIQGNCKKNPLAEKSPPSMESLK